MYVFSNTDRVSSDTSVTQNDIIASQELINTYIYVLESDTVLKEVAKDLSLTTTPSAIRSMLSASKVEDTQAFQVTVSSTDPNLAAKIANSIAKVAPDEIVRVVKAGGVEIIDYATVPTSASSPNTKKNILVGAVAGLVLSFLIFFVYEMFDTTITNAKDLEREFEIPILGTIPRLESNENTESNINDNSIGANDDILQPPIKASDDLIEKIKTTKGVGKND
jgi:capsular polysaccharide biosynthesis protein